MDLPKVEPAAVAAIIATPTTGVRDAIDSVVAGRVAAATSAVRPALNTAIGEQTSGLTGRVSAAESRIDLIDPGAPNTKVFGTFKADVQTILNTNPRPVIAVVGDSIAKKFNASSVANSWVGKMTADLKALKGDGGTGFRGMADAGYAGGTYLSGMWDQMPATDRVDLAGGTPSGAAWTNSTNAAFIYNGPGFTMAGCSTVGATATFRVTGDTISVYYLGVTSVGGTITCTVDGVAAGGTINVGSKASNGTVKTVIKTGAGPGAHTVVVTLASGGLSYFGVSAENSTGVIVNNFSKGGIAATDINAGETTAAGSAWNGGTSYPCDILIYALGINDLATTDISATQVADHARKFIAKLRESGINAPVLIVTNHAGKRDVNFRQAAVIARLSEVAEAYNGAIVNLWGKYQNSWPTANAAGYWGGATAGAVGTDDVHPSDTGHAAAWATIKPLLIPNL